ncbi:MAG: ABC transporter permease [Candidatus Aminicenantes bacterium]|nr:ABC transporter permease [Candidatus Aminicenantes bacterium]
MSEARERPSPAALRVLRLLADPDEAPYLAGDVEEEYADIRERRGRIPAALWLWFQIVISLPSFIKSYLYWRQAMFANYLRTAWRNLRKHKVFSFINIAGLAVGMACCILIFLWVKDELSFDRFHPNHDRLYRAVMRTEGTWITSSGWALAPTLKREFPEIRNATRVAPRNVLFSFEDKSIYKTVAFVDPDFLEMFRFPLRVGDPRSALAANQSAVITETTARAIFGNADPIGKILSVNSGQLQVPVTGIAADPPPNTTLRFDVLIPVRIFGEAVDTDWSYESSCYVLLDENASLDDVRKKIAPVVMKYDRRVNTVRTLDLQPLTRTRLYNLGGGGSILYVYIFATIAVFILLMACINFMNLATARAGARSKEVGLRKVVGARKSDVVRQFYGESLLHACLALVAAVGLVLLVLPAFNNLAEKILHFSLTRDAGVVLALLAITLATGVVSGSYPALFLSSFRPAVVLKGAASSGSSKPRLRKTLVVVQFTIAIVLLIGTAAVRRQLDYIQNVNLGYNRHHVVSMGMNRVIRSNYQALKDELLRDPGVVNVTAATGRPTYVGNINPFWWEGRNPGEYETMNFVATDHDYVKTFEMEIVAGRDFSREFKTDAENYIVNEAAVRLMGFEDPVGKAFSIWDNKGVIIGVVKDFHNRPLSQEITPTAITLLPNWVPAVMFVRVRPENVARTMSRIEETWRRLVPGQPFEPVFLDQSFDDLYRSDRRRGVLFRDFAALAVFISCLGIFGLAAFTAEQRTKEIGVRKVLGASVGGVVTLLSREFVVLVTIANLIAWPAGYYLTNRLLRNYAYRTDVPLWIFLGAGILAYFVALLTVSYQAFKAARTEPINALRYE